MRFYYSVSKGDFIHKYVFLYHKNIQVKVEKVLWFITDEIFLVLFVWALVSTIVFYYFLLVNENECEIDGFGYLVCMVRVIY